MLILRCLCFRWNCTPCQAAGLSHLLWIPVCGCFVPCRLSVLLLRMRMTMTTSQSLALEPSAWGSTPQCSIRKKQSIPPIPCFPVLWLHSALTCYQVFLSQVHNSISSLQTLQTLVVHNCTTPPGGGWRSYHGSGVYGNPKLKPTPGSRMLPCFSGTTQLHVTQGS